LSIGIESIVKFNDVVEAIQSLSMDEKQEIQLLLRQYIREGSRDKIYDNLRSTKEEERQGKLKFSDTVDELKELLED